MVPGRKWGGPPLLGEGVSVGGPSLPSQVGNAGGAGEGSGGIEMRGKGGCGAWAGEVC